MSKELILEDATISTIVAIEVVESKGNYKIKETSIFDFLNND